MSDIIIRPIGKRNVLPFNVQPARILLSASSVSTKSDCFYFHFVLADPRAAQLNVNTFTKELLVRKGGSARLNCEYNNALVTEWYFRQFNRRLQNSTSDKSVSALPSICPYTYT